MAITDYDSLKSALAAWLHRSDLTAMIPDFIELAEAKMTCDLDSRSMETRVNLTTVPGSAFLALPTDMVEMRRLVLETEPACVLKYASPDQIDADYPLSSSSRPAVFAVHPPSTTRGVLRNASVLTAGAYRPEPLEICTRQELPVNDPTRPSQTPFSEPLPAPLQNTVSSARAAPPNVTPAQTQPSLPVVMVVVRLSLLPSNSITYRPCALICTVGLFAVVACVATAVPPVRSVMRPITSAISFTGSVPALSVQAPAKLAGT